MSDFFDGTDVEDVVEPEVEVPEAYEPLDREAIEAEARAAMEREGSVVGRSTGHRAQDRGPGRFYEPGEEGRHATLGFIVVVGVVALVVIGIILLLVFGCTRR